MLQFGCDGLELHDIVAVWCAIQNPPVRHEGQHGLPGPGLKQGWKAMNRQFDIERQVMRRHFFLPSDRTYQDRRAHTGNADC